MADPSPPAAEGGAPPAPPAPPTPAEVLVEISRIGLAELELPREVRAEDDLLLDLQLDSVGVLTLVVGLENRYQIALREEDAAMVRTAADLAALVSARAAEGPP